ncbi:MAG: SPOR domain-containing protein [Desulfococcaceae bacterium]
MSHFYAFDRKQSLLLLFAGILLAILALMLGWIVGLLMRPPAMPETASRPPFASEQPLASSADPQRAAADTRTTVEESAGALQTRAEESGSALQAAANESGSAAQATAREAESALPAARDESADGLSGANTDDPTGAGDRSATPSPAAGASAEDAPGPAETAEASGNLGDAIPPDAKPRESADGTGNGASQEGGPSRDSSGTGAESSDEESESDFGPRTRYAVVVADFVVESKARELVKALEEKGYAGRVVHTPPERTAGRMGIYTVILGDYARSATAEIAAERFAERESGATAVRRFPAFALLPPPPSPAAPPSAAEPFVPPDPEGNPESGPGG